MHTRASNSELVAPLLEPERTLNRRLRRLHRRVPIERREEIPENPRTVYLPIKELTYFRQLFVLLNHDIMDDQPMWAADRVVAPTLGSASILPATVNKFCWDVFIQC